jgi:hypothetical protein
MLVIFQASSAPVDVVNLAKASGPAESYEALPVLYTNIESTSEEGYTDTIMKAEGLFSNFSCSACRYAVKIVQSMFDRKMSFDAIADAIGEICAISKAYSKTVCKGVAQTFKVNEFLSSPVYTSKVLCCGSLQVGTNQALEIEVHIELIIKNFGWACTVQ